MDLQLKDKTALITGSTAGIGLAVAKILDQEGARVIVNGRTTDRVNAVLKQLSGKASGVAADLTTDQGREALKRTVPAVDILVNNLGVFEAKALSDIDDNDWMRFFSINVASGAILTKHYLSPMMQRNWGRVIFIGSEAGVDIPSDMIPYGVSKAAQMALARGLAETTVGTNVTVNSVLPGPTKSEGVDQFLASLPLDQGKSRSDVAQEFLKRLRPTSLIQRFAEPEEVASLVAYLASPLSSATNGAALRVEGGLLRSVH